MDLKKEIRDRRRNLKNTRVQLTNELATEQDVRLVIQALVDFIETLEDRVKTLENQ